MGVHNLTRRRSDNIRTICYWLAVSAISTFSISVLALDDTRSGFMSPKIKKQRDNFLECTKPTYLTGLVLHQTDRVVGLSYQCTNLTLDRKWDAIKSGYQGIGLGNLQLGDVNLKICPTDYFIVGLQASFGSYSADTYGIAKPMLPAMIADLSPVCSNWQDVAYILPSVVPKQSDDNKLEVIKWDGVGNARSCKIGYAATSILFSYQKGTDPKNEFFDVALTCDRLPFKRDPATYTDHPVKPEPKPRPN